MKKNLVINDNNMGEVDIYKQDKGRWVFFMKDESIVCVEMNSIKKFTSHDDLNILTDNYHSYI